MGFAVILSVAGVVCAVLLFLFRREDRAAPVILLSAAVAFAAHSVYQAREITPLQNAVGREVEAVGIVQAVDARRLPIYSMTVRAAFPQENLPDATLHVRGWGDLYFEPGDGIRMTVRLEELFGREAYYNARGIFVGGNLREARPHAALSWAQRFEGFFLRQRAAAAERVAVNIPSANAAMVAGVTLGEIDGMDPALATALSRSGIIHIVVVSGMHLSILVGILTGLLGRLGLGRLPLALIGMSGALGFSFLVGFSPSVARGAVMLGVYLLAGVISRRSDSINSLGLALLLICIFAPHWMLSRGLWLSFAATAGIILYTDPILSWFKAGRGWESLPERAAANLLLGAAATTVAAYLFTLPILVVSVGWVSLVSPIVNVLVAPLVLPTLLFGVLSAFFTGGWVAPFAWVADLCAGLIADIALLASGLPFATFALSEFWKLLWVLLACGMAVWLVCQKAGKSLWKYGVTLLALAFAVGSVTFDLSNRGKVEAAAIAGVSPILLTREGSAVLVGTPQPHEFARLTRYLDYRGVTHLDAVVAYDAGNQITSAMIRLVEDYNAPLVIGPDDDYILGLLALALPEREILSAGYASIDVLGGVEMRTAPTALGAEIRVGGVVLVKSGEEYGISALPSEEGSAGVRFFGDGVVVWTEQAPPAFEPLGGLLFGERRLVLSL